MLYSVFSRDFASSTVALNFIQERLFDNLIRSAAMPFSMSHDFTAAIVSSEGLKVFLIYSKSVKHHIVIGLLRVPFPLTNAGQNFRCQDEKHSLEIHTLCQDSVASDQLTLELSRHD